MRPKLADARGGARPSRAQRVALPGTEELPGQSPDAQRGVAYNVHGVEVTLSSNWEDLLRLVGLDLRSFRVASVSDRALRVSLDLRKRPWTASPSSPHPPSWNGERWGTHLFGEGSDRVAYHAPPLSLVFSLDEPPTVDASFEVDRTGRLRGLFRQVPSWEEAQRAMRLGLHHPLFHLLGQRGVRLLHASAVAVDGRALVLTGLNGSGKTSLCRSLLPRFAYMADNFVLWDGREVLGVPAALHLPDGSVPDEWEAGPTVWGKRLALPPPHRTALRGRLQALVFLTRGDRTSLSPLPAPEAERRLRAIHDLDAELPRYQFPRLLALDRDPPDPADIARAGPAFHLTVNRLSEGRTLLTRLMEDPKVVQTQTEVGP